MILRLVAAISLCYLIAVVNGADHPMKTLRNSGGKYPAQYPISPGDGNIPEWSIEHEPMNNTLNPETDNGGYRYWRYYKRDLNEWDYDTYGGWCFTCGVGAAQFALKNHYKVPNGILPIQSQNCSTYFYESARLTGTVNGEQVCTSGSCCQAWIGIHRKKDDYDKWHLDMDTKVSGGLCGVMPEAIYCLIVGGHYHVSCFQTYTGPVDRVGPMLPCFDFFYNYWMGCPVYKAGGVDPGNGLEPAGYWSKLSASDKTLMSCIFWNPDRVCLPQSYYDGDDNVSVEDSSTVSLALNSLVLFLAY